MIVKFAADHAINGEVSTLLARSASTSKRIKNLVTELGNTLGVPLRFQRITSGREVIVDVSRAAAREQLAAHLVDSPDVRGADVLCDQEKTPPLEPNDELVVSFNPATAPYKVVMQAAPGTSMQALVNSLASDTPYRLLGRALPDKRLALRLDLAQSVTLLAKKMNELAEVDYAQPNFTVQAYP
ncbi:MAG: hypothetical protein ACR2P1_21595 [Pseudomonadales bacterium]